MSTALGEAMPPTRRTEAVGEAVALLILLAVTIVSARVIDFHNFSDDQKTYIRIATDILSQPVPWMPSDSFAWILAGFYRLYGDWAQTFALIYGLFAGLYLLTAYACLRWLRLGSTPALAAALISLVPHYTLGMTSWGFAGAEFVTARITILPIAVLLMTVFLRNCDSHRVTWIFPPAAVASFLHLSSAFLFSILVIAYGLVRARDLRRAFRDAVAPLLLSTAIIAPLAYRVLFPPASGGFDVILLQIYEKMAAVQGPNMDALDPAATIDLLWKAAYAGFWWTMFPPRLGDVVYVLAENGVILAAVCLAWLRRNCIASQEASLPGGLSAVAIGFTFRNLRNSVPGALLFAALLVSPTMAVRMLPETAKVFLRSAALQYGPSDLNPEYLEKALGLRGTARQELDELVESLRLARQGEACRVIGLEHELKRSGCAVFVSYQDKRSPLRNPGGHPLLLVWYLSYEEIRSAIESGDPDRIVKVAERYGANMAVLPRSVRDPRFVPVFYGLHWHAYRIETGYGAAERVPAQ